MKRFISFLVFGALVGCGGVGNDDLIQPKPKPVSCPDSYRLIDGGNICLPDAANAATIIEAGILVCDPANSTNTLCNSGCVSAATCDDGGKALYQCTPGSNPGSDAGYLGVFDAGIGASGGINPWIVWYCQ